MSVSIFDCVNIVVAGGSGVIGSGIVRHLLQQGAEVIAPVRSEEGAQRLKDTVRKEDLERLTVKITDVSDPAKAQELAASLQKEKRIINHVISSIGAAAMKGELSEQSLEDVQTQVHNLALSHFVMYKAFLPYIKDVDGSSYTFFTGGLGNSYMPGASLTTVGAACLFGISIAARGECKDKKVRVNEFRLNAWVKRDAEADASEGSFSHFTIGHLVGELVASGKRGEVCEVGAEQIKAKSLKH